MLTSPPVIQVVLDILATAIGLIVISILTVIAIRFTAMIIFNMNWFNNWITEYIGSLIVCAADYIYGKDREVK